MTPENQRRLAEIAAANKAKLAGIKTPGTATYVPQSTTPTATMPAPTNGVPFGTGMPTTFNAPQFNAPVVQPPPGTPTTGEIGTQYGTEDPLSSAIQQIMKNRAGIKATGTAGFTGIRDLSQNLAAMPGFSGMNISQANRISGIEGNTAQDLLNNGLGAADIARRRIEDITQQQQAQNKAAAEMQMATAKNNADTQTQLFNKVNAIQDNIKQDSEIINFKTIRDGYNKILSGASQNNGPGSMAVIFGYMKMLDPSSTVREGEYATAANAGTIPQAVTNLWNQYIQTGNKLSPELTQQFVNQAKQIYEAQKKPYQARVNFYSKTAEQFGIPKDMILSNFDLINPENPNIPKSVTSSPSYQQYSSTQDAAQPAPQQKQSDATSQMQADWQAYSGLSPAEKQQFDSAHPGYFNAQNW